MPVVLQYEDKCFKAEVTGDVLHYTEAFWYIYKISPSRNKNPHQDLMEDGSSSILNIQGEGKEIIFMVVIVYSCFSWQFKGKQSFLLMMLSIRKKVIINFCCCFQEAVLLFSLLWPEIWTQGLTGVNWIVTYQLPYPDIWILLAFFSCSWSISYNLRIK